MSGYPGTLPAVARSGRERVRLHAYIVAAAHNLIRIAKLSPVST